MNKKSIAVICLSLLLVCAAIFALVKLAPDESDKFHKIDPTDKIVLSDHLPTSRAFPPSLWTDVYLCNFVVQGKIVGMEPVYQALSSGIDDMDEKLASMTPDGVLPQIAYTEYTVEVKQQFIGDSVGDTIKWREIGGVEAHMTKPKGDEEVVLFLYQMSPEIYSTADYEHSIFTVDEKGRLYSFSNREDLSAFDGKPVSALIEATKQTQRDIEQDVLPSWAAAR